jgi:hypothetical protein
MNLPAKKYEFTAAFGTDATHEAVYAQVTTRYLGRIIRYEMMIILLFVVNNRHGTHDGNVTGCSFDPVCNGRVPVVTACVW